MTTRWHRDPEVVGGNRLPMSGLGPPIGAEHRIDLDGPWRFRHHIGPCPDTDWVGDEEPPWDTIDLPASWVLAGHGIPIYTNVQYPFPIDDYPEIPLDDETGDHWRRVEVPATWAGRRIVLRIGAAESAVEVWVGGRLVGCSTDSRLPAEFDVTGFMTPGEATAIGLRAHRWSASTWLEDQDMWWMAGIHRPVVLYATSPVHLADVVFTTDRLSDDRSTAQVSIAVTVDGGTEEWHGEVAVTLVDPHGETVFGPASADIDMGAPSVERAEIAEPRLWSAETPELYRLDVELRRDGTTVDAQSLQVGIRTVRVGRGQLLVNHRPVTIRGVNRHEHHPERGRVQTDELLAIDGALLKAANVNAVRTAHYPDDERFYALCDRIGLYVIDEANIETHGLVHDRARLPADDPRFADAFVARARRMVARDRNHPCVIAWSLGNESGLGRNHRLAADAVRAADPTRPLHYHPAEDTELVDIVGPMYPTLGDLERLADTADGRPVIMCEYSHAMGNSNGGLADYWDLIAAHHRLGGGFIWDWVDQGLAQATSDGGRWWAYGGDFGDEPNDANFNLNGVVDADRRPHPALLHVAWVHRPVAVTPSHRRFLATPADGAATSTSMLAVTVMVENRRDHVDLSGLVLTWRLLCDDAELASTTVDPPQLGPGETDELRLELTPVTDVGAGELRLRFEWRARSEADGPAGVIWPGAPETYRGLVAWDELPLPVADATPPGPARPLSAALTAAPGATAAPATTAAPASPSAHATSDGGSTLRAGGTEVVLDPLGQPLTLRLGGRELDVLDARLGIDRAPTDNDDATFGPDRVLTRLRRAGLAWPRIEPRGEPRVSVVDGVASVDVRLTIAGTGLRLRCRWLVDDSGDVAVELSAIAALDVPPLLRLGFELDLPRRFRTVTWFGPGPLESYPDRVRGLLLDRWSGSVDEQLFPYARPQESGNHTDLRWLAVTDDRDAGLVAIGDPRFDGAALPIGARALAAAEHLHEIEWPSITVLRLDAAHGGLGTASCGPGVARRFEVDARSSIANRILLRAVEPGADPGAVAARPSALRRTQRWHYGDGT